VESLALVVASLAATSSLALPPFLMLSQLAIVVGILLAFVTVFLDIANFRSRGWVV
jgi:hypothetical protein